MKVLDPFSKEANEMIVIVTYEKYPDGSPGAIRCNSFAEAYIRLGYEVAVIHSGTFEQDVCPQVFSCYDANRTKKFLLFERKAIGILEILKNQHSLRAVLTYDFFGSINRWCRKNNIINVVDVVEWYSKEQFKSWYLSFEYLSKQLKIHNIVKRKANVIAISSFLEKHFSSSGCKTVRIPIISDEVVDCQSALPDMSTINFIYAGTHAVMDNVLIVIKSIVMLPESARKRIKFSVYGLKHDIMTDSFSPTDQSIIDECVIFYGRRPNSEVLSAYLRSHFSIFFRDPELRVNKAGFPSKVIESMKMGVPVLCNYSSDLNQYLKSGDNSIIVNNLSEDDICKVLLQVLALSPSDYANLHNNAIATVREQFNAEVFSTEFRKILS